jgi:CubicO group peptidase (beta-lactamase class C family)
MRPLDGPASSPLAVDVGRGLMGQFDAARAVIQRAIETRAFPAAVVEVGDATRVRWLEAFGRLTFAPHAAATRTHTIFDLASLTKVLATSTLTMEQIERGALGLDDTIGRYFPTWTGDDRAGVTVRDLLAHCSGLVAHQRLFERHAGRAAFEAAICTAPLVYPPRSGSIYSDLGFILAGFLLDTELSLAARFEALRTRIDPGTEIQFSPPAAWRSRTAPTEQDPWRGRLLIGEVHDENAWALGGSTGHAGLFGTASAVGAFARHFLQVLDGRVGIVQQRTLETFIARRTDVPGSSRALGWDTMLPTSSCGTCMSPRAFGQVGFTGTSLWIDPEAGVYVVFLTNRVHPSRGNEAIGPVRRALHDAVMAGLQPR